VIQSLSKPTKTTFRDIRKILAEGDISDFDSMYKKLYNDIDKYAKDKEGLVVIAINEHIFQSVSVLDKEICFCACIARILEII
jgi:hypothetical protein